MNVRPDRFKAVVADLATLRDEVAALTRLLNLCIKQPAADRDPSVLGFCKRHGISRSTYENWRRAGLAPAETRGPRRIIITEDAENDWLAERAKSPAAADNPRT